MLLGCRAPRYQGLGSAQSRAHERGVGRPPGYGKLGAGPKAAQRAEGARPHSGGFDRFLMGRICSGLRFKKKFDLWNRRLGELKLDATD